MGGKLRFWYELRASGERNLVSASLNRLGLSERVFPAQYSCSPTGSPKRQDLQDPIPVRVAHGWAALHGAISLEKWLGAGGGVA